MKSQKNQGLLVIIVVLITLAGASIACRFIRPPEPTPTPVPTETATSLPTETPLPTATETPLPTATATATATETPEPTPTETPEPTATDSVQRPSLELGPPITDDQIIQVDEDPESMVYQAGDVLSSNNQHFMVLGWEVLPGDGFFAPDPGFMYIAVDMIIVNTNPEPIAISSFLQTDIKSAEDEDSADYSYSIWASVAIKSHMIDGSNILPGERVRVKIGFEVPEDASEMLFGYTTEFFFTSPIWIALDDAPGLLSPPAFIPGELERPVFALGEQIDLNGLSLNVINAYETAGQQFYAPDDGHTYIIVELTLTNNSGSPIELSSDHFLLEDRTSLRYGTDFSATLMVDGGVPDEEIQVGETVYITLGYEVPFFETSPHFLFDATDWDLGKILVETMW